MCMLCEHFNVKSAAKYRDGMNVSMQVRLRYKFKLCHFGLQNCSKTKTNISKSDSNLDEG